MEGTVKRIFDNDDGSWAIVLKEHEGYIRPKRGAAKPAGLEEGASVKCSGKQGKGKTLLVDAAITLSVAEKPAPAAAAAAPAANSRPAVKSGKASEFREPATIVMQGIQEAARFQIKQELELGLWALPKDKPKALAAYEARYEQIVQWLFVMAMTASQRSLTVSHPVGDVQAAPAKPAKQEAPAEEPSDGADDLSDDLDGAAPF